MRALIIGADEQLGFELTKKLNELNYNLIVTGKNKRKLEKIKEDISDKIVLLSIDVASTYNCKKLFNYTTNEDLDLVINCTNNMYCGNFLENSIDNDLDLIDLNITSMHTITKLFLKYFEEKNSGFILNIVPLKSYFPNPLMATYMACKSYALKLTKSINYEEKIKNKKVVVSCFCDNQIDKENIDNIINSIIDGIEKKKTYISTNKFLKTKYYFKKWLSSNHNINTNYRKNKIG